MKILYLSPIEIFLFCSRMRRQSEKEEEIEPDNTFLFKTREGKSEIDFDMNFTDLSTFVKMLAFSLLTQNFSFLSLLDHK